MRENRGREGMRRKGREEEGVNIVSTGNVCIHTASVGMQPSLCPSVFALPEDGPNPCSLLPAKYTTRPVESMNHSSLKLCTFG